ncbi:serine carboxypeptidase S28 [Ancylostoma ceylanicum]|uniref:Serine carboxypeptidase S28 n=1 Tax=Ancylostoma ceylanicum TaxID=53326 RepID=A0A0D6LUR7_9BILA|nr:serine carboxypeptidase S28 [Ancylostoma ceylanicum]
MFSPITSDIVKAQALIEQNVRRWLTEEITSTPRRTTNPTLKTSIPTKIWAAHSWQPKFHLGRAMFGMQTDDESFSMRNPDEDMNLPRYSDAKEEYFDQKLDHFDDSSQQTWRQRYFHNFKYTNGSNNIQAVFLRLGGEGPLRISTVSNEANQMMTLAKQYGAAAFALEHRFYGVSRPTPNQSVKNLRYLSSRQALKDIAYFIEKMNTQYNLKGARWITFGGSYAGYLEVVEDALRNHSSACAENVRKGFEKMTYLMKTREGRDQLSKIFVYASVNGSAVLKAPLADLELSYNDIQYFFMVLYENFQMATQYNEVNVNPFNNAFGIKHVCDIMTKGNDDSIKKIQAVNVYMAAGARSWTWQTCTEFGYYQTTDGGPKGIFGDVTPLSVFVNMCTDVFGKKFNANYIEAAVRATQRHYGSAEDFDATNVVIPNGSVDPWHRLGKLVSYYNSVVTYLIEGTAHCAEMSPPGPNDKPGLKTVREIIRENIAKWLTEPRSQSTVLKTKPVMKTVMPRARTTYPKQEEETAEKPILQSQMVTEEEIEPQFITQPFDHFNSRDQRTFRQKYYMNDEWAKPDGPMFLLIGGEAPLDSQWVKGFGFFHQVLAEKIGATVFALEHRYYGDSVVGGTATDPNPDLTYLSSLQAIYDVAHFIRTMDAKMNRRSKWITFGGSYAGCLSLWLRQGFPELVRGAVASSAPVEVKLDFYEYLEVTERSLRRYQPICAENTAKGFDLLHKLSLTKSGRKKLSDTFTLRPPWNESSIVSDVDIQFFFNAIKNVYQAMVQTGYRHEVCRFLANETNPVLHNMAKLNERIIQYWTVPSSTVHILTIEDNNLWTVFKGRRFNGTDNSYTDAVEFYKVAQKHGPQFGYYQSTDTGYNAFGSPTPLRLNIVSFYTRLCVDIFGDQFKAAAIENSVRKMNKFFGGRDNFEGSNVVATNGDVDPWHALGLYNHSDKSVVSFLMDGTWHTGDMFMYNNTALRAAQALIEQNVRKWLTEEITSTPRPSTKQTTSTPRPSTKQTTSTPRRTTKPVPITSIPSEIWAAHSWQPKFHLSRAMFGTQTDDESFSMRNPDEKMNLSKDSDAKTDYIEQKLDHFDDSSQKRWRQRYYYNFKYTGGSNNIKAVFLRLGGEGPLRIGTVSNEANQMMTLAKQYGAAAFALEHRFYGVSRPTPNQSVDNLRYLSSHQALKDTAYFIQKMTEKHKLKGARWVTFGGSYAGALSLWFRQQYPHLIAGAVGSSAPLDAEFDFWGYLEVVEDALRSQHSNECAENVRKGFQKMTSLMKTKEGREQLSKIFMLKAPLTNITLSYNNIQYFYQVIYENFQLATQYNEVNVNPYKDGYGIKQVCDIMTRGNEDPVTKLQAVNLYMAQLHGDFKYTDNSYDDMIRYLRREEFDGENFDSGARSWTWQTCTEFGYYQTTDGGPKGIFGDVTPLSVFVNMCTDVFGKKFNANYIDAAVRATQAHYGSADNFKATNVVIPNGSVDPWHRLGKLVSYYTSVVTYLINAINSNKKVALPRVRTTYPKQEEETAENRILQSQMSHDAKRTLAVETNFITQPIDHFGIDDNRTFKQGLEEFASIVSENLSGHQNCQKYYKNSEWAKPNGPMFLYIGGEAPLSSAWVNGFGMFHLGLAEKLGATVFALEHRYYGDSVVGGTAKDPNPDLTYLSSLQMMFDVENFIRTMDAKMNKTSKWITFGGSYAEYLEVVERSLRKYSPECADNIGKGFDEIHKLVLTKSGRKKLSDLFTLKPAWSENTIVSDQDIQFFFHTIYTVYQAMVQQDHRNEVCMIMTNKTNSPLQNMAYLNERIIEYWQGSNVVATNGDIDPWHALGLYKSNDASVVTFLLNGSSHCADMFLPSTPDIVKAQTLIEQNVRRWLTEEITSTPRRTTKQTTSTPRPNTSIPTKVAYL